LIGKRCAPRGSQRPGKRNPSSGVALAGGPARPYEMLRRSVKWYRKISGDDWRKPGATLPFEGMSKANVRKLRDVRADAPEAANFRLKQISALFSWAVKEEHAKVNPAEAWNAWRMRARASAPGPNRTFSPSSAIIRLERSRALRWHSFSGLA
ncbi:MAG TPA: hypothetical protein VNR65_08790, partial [Geobacterales bacterium]|nr:hypothetical protein [Geobacterales bacterium]